MNRLARTRPARQTHGVHAPAREVSRESIVRLIEQLLAKGYHYDTVERFVAGWIRDSGAQRGDVERAVRADAFHLGRGPKVVERIERHLRRPGPGPIVVEPLARPSRTAQVRDEAWFLHLKHTAEAARWTMPAYARPAPAPHHVLSPIRSFEQVASGAVAFGRNIMVSQTSIAPQVSPGVYALQLDRNDALAAGHGSSLPDMLKRLGPGRPLPAPMRAEMGARLADLGYALDLDQIVVHTGAEADRLCRDLRANALALGRHVAFASGRFDLASDAGLGLLAHELIHVWQQLRGKARGGGLLLDPALEAEAVRGGATLARDWRRPMPRARDALVDDTKTTLGKTGVEPSATFVVGDRIDAFDRRMRLRGSWPITGQVPHRPGHWLDGGVGVEGWSAMTREHVADLTGGRADDLWVVGGQHGAVQLDPLTGGQTEGHPGTSPARRPHVDAGGEDMEIAGIRAPNTWVTPTARTAAGVSAWFFQHAPGLTGEFNSFRQLLVLSDAIDVYDHDGKHHPERFPVRAYDDDPQLLFYTASTNGRVRYNDVNHVAYELGGGELDFEALVTEGADRLRALLTKPYFLAIAMRDYASAGPTQEQIEGGAGASNLPPYAAKIEGPDRAVPRAVPTWSMHLKDEFDQVVPPTSARFMWQLFNVTDLVQSVTPEQTAAAAGTVRSLPTSVGGAITRTDGAAGRGRQRMEAEIDESGRILDETGAAASRAVHARTLSDFGSAVLQVVAGTAATLVAGATFLPRIALTSYRTLAEGAMAVASERQIEMPDPISEVATHGVGGEQTHRIPLRGFQVFIVRCIAQPAAAGDERRAWSVATKVVEVAPPQVVARETMEDEDRKLEIAELTAMDDASRAAYQAQATAISGDARLVLSDRLQQAYRQQHELEAQKAALEHRYGSQAQYALDYRTLVGRLEQLDETIKSLETQSQAAAAQARDVERMSQGGVVHRPRAIFVDNDTGQSVPVLLELGVGDSGGLAHALVIDVTTAESQRTEATATHYDQAIWGALREMAGKINLGRGTMVVRLPEALGADYGITEREHVFDVVPTSWSLVRSRMEAATGTLMFAAMFLSGGAAVAVGGAAAFIGAASAAAKIKQRIDNHQFEWNWETLNDILDIASAPVMILQHVAALKAAAAAARAQRVMAVVEAGQSTGSAGRAAHMYRSARRAERILGAIESSLDTIDDGIDLIQGADGIKSSVTAILVLNQQEANGDITHSAAISGRLDHLMSIMNTVMPFLRGHMGGPSHPDGAHPDGAHPDAAHPEAEGGAARPRAPARAATRRGRPQTHEQRVAAAEHTLTAGHSSALPGRRKAAREASQVMELAALYAQLEPSGQMGLVEVRVGELAARAQRVAELHARQRHLGEGDVAAAGNQALAATFELGRRARRMHDQMQYALGRALDSLFMRRANGEIAATDPLAVALGELDKETPGPQRSAALRAPEMRVVLDAARRMAIADARAALQAQLDSYDQAGGVGTLNAAERGALLGAILDARALEGDGYFGHEPTAPGEAATPAPHASTGHGTHGARTGHARNTSHGADAHEAPTQAPAGTPGVTPTVAGRPGSEVPMSEVAAFFAQRMGFDFVNIVPVADANAFTSVYWLARGHTLGHPPAAYRGADGKIYVWSPNQLLPAADAHAPDPDPSLQHTIQRQLRDRASGMTTDMPEVELAAGIPFQPGGPITAAQLSQLDFARWGNTGRMVIIDGDVRRYAAEFYLTMGAVTADPIPVPGFRGRDGRIWMLTDAAGQMRSQPLAPTVAFQERVRDAIAAMPRVDGRTGGIAPTGAEMVGFDGANAVQRTPAQVLASLPPDLAATMHNGRIPEGTHFPVPDAATAAQLYRSMFELDPSREVGLYANIHGNGFLLVQGRVGSVLFEELDASFAAFRSGDGRGAQSTEDHWVIRRHFHPGGGHGEGLDRNQVPTDGQLRARAGGMRLHGDIGVAIDDLSRMMAAHPGLMHYESRVDFWTGTGYGYADYGVDRSPAAVKAPYWVSWRLPPEAEGAAPRTGYKSFATLEEYLRFAHEMTPGWTGIPNAAGAATGNPGYAAEGNGRTPRTEMSTNSGGARSAGPNVPPGPAQRLGRMELHHLASTLPASQVHQYGSLGDFTEVARPHFGDEALDHGFVDGRGEVHVMSMDLELVMLQGATTPTPTRSGQGIAAGDVATLLRQHPDARRMGSWDEYVAEYWLLRGSLDEMPPVPAFVNGRNEVVYVEGEGGQLYQTLSGTPTISDTTVNGVTAALATRTAEAGEAAPAETTTQAPIEAHEFIGFRPAAGQPQVIELTPQAAATLRGMGNQVGDFQVVHSRSPGAYRGHVQHARLGTRPSNGFIDYAGHRIVLPPETHRREAATATEDPTSIPYHGVAQPARSAAEPARDPQPIDQRRAGYAAYMLFSNGRAPGIAEISVSMVWEEYQLSWNASGGIGRAPALGFETSSGRIELFVAKPDLFTVDRPLPIAVSDPPARRTLADFIDRPIYSTPDARGPTLPLTLEAQRLLDTLPPTGDWTPGWRVYRVNNLKELRAPWEHANVTTHTPGSTPPNGFIDYHTMTIYAPYSHHHEVARPPVAPAAARTPTEVHDAVHDHVTGDATLVDPPLITTTPGLAPPAFGTPKADLEAFIEHATMRDLQGYWWSLGNWAIRMRVEARRVSPQMAEKLRQARQELYAAALAYSGLKDNVVGSTGATSDIDPTFLGVNTIEDARRFAAGMERALRERGLDPAGWRDILGINPYTDDQSARFGIRERVDPNDATSALTPAAQEANDRLLSREGVILEMHHRNRLMNLDPSGARWEQYKHDQLAYLELQGEAAVTALQTFFRQVETHASAYDRQLAATAREIDASLSTLDDGALLRRLRSAEGAALQRQARARMLGRAYSALTTSISEAVADTPPSALTGNTGQPVGQEMSIANRERVLMATQDVKALEEEGYNISALASVVGDQQTNAPQRTGDMHEQLALRDMDPIARMNALVDSANMAEEHLEQVHALYRALLDRARDMSPHDATEEIRRGMPAVLAPLGKYLGRVLIEATELGIPINDRYRLFASVAAAMKSRVGLTTGDALEMIANAEQWQLTHDGVPDLGAFEHEMGAMLEDLRTSINTRRALGLEGARAMTPDARIGATARTAGPGQASSDPQVRRGVAGTPGANAGTAGSGLRSELNRR